MKLSKKFLNDYIDVDDINYKDLAEKMVSVGNEYEEIYRLCNCTGLVVGKVLECIEHPNSDHLHITKVDIGTDVLQIVCGAPNVMDNIKVIVATIGASLPGGIIKACKLAGTDSCGMLCSLEELGLPKELLKEEDKLGIHILDDDALVGSNAVNYLGLDDEIIDFELTANRADLLSVIGAAYEVGAIYDRQVKLPEFLCEETKEDINKNYSLDVQTDKCSIYTGKLVKNVIIKESPNFIKSRLIASGMRSINNVVDISNYVMLEYGQPLHFFDADQLGTKIIVRNAEDNEEIITLDSNKRILDSNDIVIASNKAVALAGVMGGLDTEVTTATKNIFIESAIFDSPSIRKTSKKILRSEASNRYEKGVDPSRTITALNRACYLLNKYASGSITKGTLIYDKTNKEDKKIIVSLDKINQVLGMDLNVNDVLDIIKRLGFKGNAQENIFTVLVPTRRLDVNIKEELIEEIGRIYGLTNIKSTMPILPIKKGSRSKKGELELNVRNRLTALGLMQVMGYSLLSLDKSKMFVNENKEDIKILSPMTDDRVILRNSLIPSLLDIYNYNNARKVEDINIFEIGKKYTKMNEEYIEETLVSGLVAGSIINNSWNGTNVKADFYLIKGIVENLLQYLGFRNRYSFVVEPLIDMHSGRSAAIYIEKEFVGFLGQINPNIAKNIYVFEINLNKILNKKVRNIKCKEISKFPSITKDLAFIVSKDLESEKIVNVIKKVGGRLLTNIEVFDLYIGENVDNDKKSIAYSLTFNDQTKTLSDEEVMLIFNKIILEVERSCNARLRDNKTM